MALWLVLAAGIALGSAFLARRAAEVWAKPKKPTPTTAIQQRWFSDEVVVTLDESLDSLGPRAEEVARNAFATWMSAGAPVPRIRFQRGRVSKPSLSPDGVNSIQVAPIEFDGHQTDLAITIGFSHPRSGEITEADIVINARHVFAIMDDPEAEQAQLQALSRDTSDTDLAGRPSSCLGNFDGSACGQSYDLQNVLTHEVGHFWGLPEDFENRSSTMYSCTSACEVHKRHLSQGDIFAVQELYGSLPATAGCSVARYAGGFTTISTSVTGSLLLWSCFWGVRRRRTRHELPLRARTKSARHEHQRA